MRFFNVKLFVIGIITLLFLIIESNSEVVCSEDELVKELIQDIEDNGKIKLLNE